MDDLKSAAALARSRLEAVEVVSLHLNGLIAVVRAMVHTHPEPNKVREACDQLIGQMLANPAYLKNPDYGVILRSFEESVFQPPVEL